MNAMNQPPPSPKKRHSFRPLLFAPPQGPDALPPTIPPPARTPATRLPKPGSLPSLPPLPRAPKPEPKAGDSHVRLRSPAPAALPRPAEIEFLDAQDLLDELCEDQLTVSMNLACLERAVEQAPRDPSARAALRTLEMRLADLCAMRDALATLQLATADRRVHRLFVPDSPLADYLRGLYAWVQAVVRALDQLATSLRDLAPDWALLRWRIEEAKNFHFDELHDDIRADLHALTIVANAGSFGANRPAVEDLSYAVERLFSTATALEEHLDERFG
jgi:hypothetical protein